MRFLYSRSIIFTIATLLSCQKKEFITSSIFKKSNKKISIKSNLDSTKIVRKNHYLSHNIATEENIENQIKYGKAKFISFGIADQDFRKFKEKYGIDLQTEGCVIDSFSSKRAKLNNTFLAQYLTNKYGEAWKKDLPSKPFGLDNI